MTGSVENQEGRTTNQRGIVRRYDGDEETELGAMQRRRRKASTPSWEADMHRAKMHVT